MENGGKLISGYSVAVTGGRGAIGRRLAAQLAAAGVRRIIALDRSHAPAPAPGVQHIAGDILSLPEVQQALQGCDMVFHLAALTHAGKSASEPERFRAVNAEGTKNVMEACRHAGVKRVLYASTGHVYGTPQYLSVTEDHPTNPLSIYAETKLAGEKIVRDYAPHFEGGVAVLRLANVYGGEIGPETVIGCAIQQAASGGPIQLRNLTAVRDFMYVEDAAGAFVQLSALAGKGQCDVVNISNGKGVKLRDMAGLLVAAAKKLGLGDIAVAPPEEQEETGIPVFVLDNARLRSMTGWSPSTSLDKGLELALKDALNQTT